jgi:hypothetical protein
MSSDACFSRTLSSSLSFLALEYLLKEKKGVDYMLMGFDCAEIMQRWDKTSCCCTQRDGILRKERLWPDWQRLLAKAGRRQSTL